MIPFHRGPQPDYLAPYKKLGREWRERREGAREKKTKMPTFTWPTHEGIKLGQALLAKLLEISKEHCAYCDGMLNETSLSTIDHFRPKSRYPRLALVWHNLFPSCDICQKAKGSRTHRAWLKPDRDYTPAQPWFIVNFTTGALEANPALPQAQRARAEQTITDFDLCNRARCKSRLRHLKLNPGEHELDDLPYRYLF